MSFDTPRGVRTYGVLLAPSYGLWRARLITYPRLPWVIEGGRGAIKFSGSSAEQAESKAIEYLEQWCAEHACRRREAAADAPAQPGFPQPRKRRCMPIRYGPDSPTRLATTVNLSTHGLYVAMPAPPEPGTMLCLELELYDHVAAMRGMVAWRRESLQPGRPRGAGIRLIDAPAVYRSFVKGLS